MENFQSLLKMQISHPYLRKMIQQIKQVTDIFKFIEKSEICNIADDNTIYDCSEDLPNILENLKHDMKILLTWFTINTLQANPGKFHFMILGKNKQNSVKLIINLTETEES